MRKTHHKFGDVSRKQFIVYAYCLFFALSTPFSSAQSASPQTTTAAGHIVLVNGEVIARDTNGTDRILARRSEVFEGDTIYTGESASAQFRMIDGALIALKESTEFAILEYQWQQNPVSDASTLELIQGGFRTISGGIGTQNREAYQTRISTFATIGIRGTDYEVVITAQGNVITGVYQGGTTFSNAAGQLDLGLGADYDFAEITDQILPPRGLVVQPVGLGNIPLAVINNAGNSNGNGNANGGGAAGNANTNQAQTAAAVNGNSNGAGNALTNGDTANLNTNAGATRPTLNPPSPQIVANTPAASVASNQLSNDLQAQTSALTINPTETQSTGSISCATGSQLCVQLTDGQILNPEPTDPPTDLTTGGTDSSSGNDGDPGTGGNNGNGNAGGNNGNGNAGGNNGNGNAGGNNGNGNAGGNTDNGNAGGNNGNSNAGGNNGNGNAGGNNGNSNAGGNADNGNAGGNNGNGNAGGNADNGNAGGNNGNGNAGGNADNGNAGGNNGNGNAGGNADNGNAGGNNGNGNAGGNTDNGNAGGNTGNGNAGGNNGNGNAGGNTGNGNAGGNNSNNITDDTDGSTGSSNPGNNNNTGGNSPNSGNGGGNSGGNSSNGSGNVVVTNINLDVGEIPLPVDKLLTRPQSSVQALEISWGKWDANLDQNWVVVAHVEEDLVLLSTGEYFANVSPTEIAKLSGSHHYATSIVSSFIGSGSAGDINQLVANMDVDFTSGRIANGNLMLSVAEQVWSVDFGGLVQQGQVSLTPGKGMLMDDSGIISQSIQAELGGVFAGPSGETFVGGFDMLDQLNPFNSVEGIFTLER